MSTDNPGVNPGDKPPGFTGDPNPGDPGAKKTYTAEEFETLVREKNWAAGSLRKVQDKVTELEAELEQFRAGQKKKAEPNDEAVRTIAELKQKLDAANGELKSVTVKSDLRSKLEGKIREGAFDALWKLEGDKFDIVEENGAKKVVIRGMEWLTIDEYVRDYLPKTHPYFLANTRLPGTGPGEKGEVKNEGIGALPADWQGYSQAQKEEYFRKMTPDQRKAFRKAAGL